jgi:hypothetical protein
MNRSWLRFAGLGLSALSAVAMTAVGSTSAAQAEAGEAAASPAPAAPAEAVKLAEGLWAYTFLQAGRTGEVLPLTGVILYKDGLFVQQSISDTPGVPFEQQGAMAHAGPFGEGPKGIHMVGEQTIGISPAKSPALSFRRDTQHDISVARDGDAMTLVFGSGTTQKFRRIGPAAGDMYKLENGVLALVDGHFVLVAGDEKAVVTGYGKATHKGNAYALEVIRWAEATPAKAINRKDVTIKATFDGKVFKLADGRTFKVVGKK